MTKPIDLGSVLWAPMGLMRVVLVPADIEPGELSRIMVVGRYWLDKREWNAARLLVQGMTRKQMCDSLGVSDDSVGESMSRLYGKLRAGNEKEACYVLGRSGLWVPKE